MTFPYPEQESLHVLSQARGWEREQKEKMDFPLQVVDQLSSSLQFPVSHAGPGCSCFSGQAQHSGLLTKVSHTWTMLLLLLFLEGNVEAFLEIQ